MVYPELLLYTFLHSWTIKHCIIPSRSYTTNQPAPVLLVLRFSCRMAHTTLAVVSALGIITHVLPWRESCCGGQMSAVGHSSSSIQEIHWWAEQVLLLAAAPQEHGTTTHVVHGQEKQLQQAINLSLCTQQACVCCLRVSVENVTTQVKCRSELILSFPIQ